MYARFEDQHRGSMDQGPGVERCAVGPIVKMGQRLRDAGAQEIVGDLGSVAALLAGTQALSPGEAQPKQIGIVMGEADIGDAGGKKARAAAARPEDRRGGKGCGSTVNVR